MKEKSSDLKARQKRAVLDKYGGGEYLDGTDGLGSANGTSASGSTSIKHADDDKKVRFGESHVVEQYTREGRMVKGPSSKMRVNQKSKYEEDIFVNGHKVVWGSYFHKGAFRWGYGDDHSLMKNSYFTGDNGRRANDESNEMRYGSGVAGSAAIAQARAMLSAVPRSEHQSSSASAPLNSSALYGEADSNIALDETKVNEAKNILKNSEQNMKDDRKRKYNSVDADVDVTAECMEAYRMTKGRSDDPMSKLGSEELLEYS